MRVELVYCPRPGDCDQVRIEVAEGTTVDQALRLSGLLDRHGLSPEGLRIGVWCKVRPGDTVLRDLDRIEVYRDLKVDPKEARRQRYKGSRARKRAP